jgi:SAM-dependent methyltransferase
MFLIPPADLEKRRGRCRPEAEKLRRLNWETVSFCNLCSSRRSVTVSLTDRYGLPAHTVLCLDCGLFYLADCFTAESYSQFYSNGAYRSVCSQFNNVSHTIEQIRADQRNYAQTLGSVLARYVQGQRAGKLLDVGGSAGIVASEFVRKFNLRGTVLDPAEEEIAAARASGLDAVVGSVEGYDTEETYDLVLLCRSVEHLMDLRAAFARIRALLKPGGLFYCDIADFMELCQQVGPPETVAKIDHRYWLTQATALNIFGALGFELVSMDIAFGFGYAGYLLRPCEPIPRAAAPEERIHKLLEQIHRIQLDWTQFGRASRGIVERLRHKAYRAKRVALRFAARATIKHQMPKQLAETRPSASNGRSQEPVLSLPLVATALRESPRKEILHPSVATYR